MNDKIVAVMGYPDKPNKYRFNTNRNTVIKPNSKNDREQ